MKRSMALMMVFVGVVLALAATLIMYAASESNQLAASQLELIDRMNDDQRRLLKTIDIQESTINDLNAEIMKLSAENKRLKSELARCKSVQIRPAVKAEPKDAPSPVAPKAQTAKLGAVDSSAGQQLKLEGQINWISVQGESANYRLAPAN